MKREFAKAFILVDNSEDGTVQNIAMFNDYEEANRAARAAYGDDAFAEEYKWLVQTGDRCHKGIFYTVDGDVEEPAEYIPTDSEQIFLLSNENAELTIALADLIGGVSE